MDRDETQTESGITKLIDMLDEYLTPNPFLNLEQTYRQCKTREKIRKKVGMSTKRECRDL